MNAEKRHIADIRSLLDALESTDSSRLTVDYGKRITRMLKELSTYRKLRCTR